MRPSVGDHFVNGSPAMTGPAPRQSAETTTPRLLREALADRGESMGR
jgi:hypothetical protein